MKGIELPMSTIVVIIIVLLVLLAVLALFYGIWPNSVGSVNLESAKGNACQMLVSKNGCTNDPGDITTTILVSGFDANKDGSNVPGLAYVYTGNPTNDCGHGSDNLFMLCYCWYNINGIDFPDTNNNCKIKICGCSNSTS